MTLVRPPANLPPNPIADTYLRDSGGDKQDRSVPRQLEAILAYCKEHNITLRNVYKDVAKSGGSTVGRDDFDRLISDTKNEANRPHIILLWNYARFARDLDDSTYYKALLRSKRGILIHSLTDQIPEGPYARFVEILIDISNEEKRRQTAIDTKDGLRSLVAQGAVPGVPPRGFKREPLITINPRTGQERKNHRWVPDPKLIHRVRKAFEMRAARMSLNEINKATKLFVTINSYSTFFTNKLFIGTLVYGGIVYENYCKPIISQELWDQVQIVQAEYQLSQNVKEGKANHPRRQASDFLLSGLARHTKCGSPLYGHTSHQPSGYKYQSYFCTLAYRRRGECVKERIPRPAFEAAVINTLTERILTPENVDEMHRLIIELETASAAQTNEQRLSIQHQIKENNRALNNITRAIEQSGSSTTLLERLKTLEHEAKQLNFQLTTIEKEITTPPQIISPQKLKIYLDQLIHLLKTNDIQTQKIILRSIIAHVEVERITEKELKIDIYYYLPLDPNTPLPTSYSGDDDDTPEIGGSPIKYVPTPHPPSGPPEK